MNYRHFERLIIALGAAALLSSMLVMPSALRVWPELLAQSMFLVVLVGAVHWGRKGGFVAAAVASLIYILVRVPVLAVAPEVSLDVAVMLLSRIVAYGIVGIIGGEVCSRIKYSLARMSGDATIDDVSRVYNQRFASRTLDAAHGRHARYGEPFSVVLITLSPSLMAGMRGSKQRHLIRSAASHIRSDIRMVDEVARLDDGRFFVLLPHTPRAGAEVVTERLATGLRSLMGARPEAVTAICLGADGDLVAIDSLRKTLQSSSYKDDASTTEKPAEASTASAPSASILKMSTAAPPEGSTKQ